MISAVGTSNSFLKQQASDAAFLKSGDVLEGVILARLRRELHIDLGAFGTGMVFGKEFNASKDYIKQLSIGDKVMARVLDVDNEWGNIELALIGSGQDKQWDRIREVKEKGEIVNLSISGANRGGLVAEFEGIKGFIPVSQLSVDHYPRVDGGNKDLILDHLRKLIGQELHVKILDFDPLADKLVFSERSAYSEQLQKVLENIKVGDIIDGGIVSVVDFGAFMRFGDPPLEGLIHISEIDHRLVRNTADYLKVGDQVKAKVISIDKGRVSLSLKALQEDPWQNFAKIYKVGDVISGEVVKHNPFGAFIKVSDDIQGLAHISQFGNNPEKLSANLKIQEKYNFIIELIDSAERKLGLKLTRGDLEVSKDALEEDKKSSQTSPQVIDK